MDSFTAEPKATAFPRSAVAFGSEVNDSFLAARGITLQVLAESAKSTYQVAETDDGPNLDDLTLVFDRKFLMDQLDRLGDQIEQDGKEFKFDLNMTIATTAMATTAGYILWTLRGSFLMATLLSSLPSWKFIDPLPVLETGTARLDDSSESLESMVESSNASQSGSPNQFAERFRQPRCFLPLKHRPA